jgi:hypothetical protein
LYYCIIPDIIELRNSKTEIGLKLVWVEKAGKQKLVCVGVPQRIVRMAGLSCQVGRVDHMLQPGIVHTPDLPERHHFAVNIAVDHVDQPLAPVVTSVSTGVRNGHRTRVTPTNHTGRCSTATESQYFVIIDAIAVIVWLTTAITIVGAVMDFFLETPDTIFHVVIRLKRIS